VRRPSRPHGHLDRPVDLTRTYAADRAPDSRPEGAAEAQVRSPLLGSAQGFDALGELLVQCFHFGALLLNGAPGLAGLGLVAVAVMVGSPSVPGALVRRASVGRFFDAMSRNRRPTQHLRDADGFGSALAALLHGINEDFAFNSKATTVRTTLPELLGIRAVVCQDFAHLALGALRSVGLLARYVSGYIETTPAPGATKLVGSDASHAWVSVRVPDGSWVDLDPTNDHFCDSRYLVSAWGRDFADVSLLKGVIYTQDDVTTSSTLRVGVDVTRV